MKSETLKSPWTLSLLTALALPVWTAAQGPSRSQAQKSEPIQYNLVDLGPVGGAPGQPVTIATNGLISGAAATLQGTQHAVLWYRGLKLDIGRHGLGGANSVAFGDNVMSARQKPLLKTRTGKTFAASRRWGFPPPVLACHSYGDTGG